MAAKNLFYFRASGGFADTKMYHLAGQARKHAQKLAKDLGRVVTYHKLGGKSYSVKPPKVNPCKPKKPAGKGPSKTNTGWQVTASNYSRDKAYARAERYRDVGWFAKVKKIGGLKAPLNYRVFVRWPKAPGHGKAPAAKASGRNPAPAGYSKAWYARGFRAGVQGRNRDQYTAWHGQKGKPKTSGKRVEAQESFYQGFHDGKGRRKNPAALGDWVSVKGAKAVRVRRVKGATILDVKT